MDSDMADITNVAILLTVLLLFLIVAYHYKKTSIQNEIPSQTPCEAGLSDASCSHNMLCNTILF